MPTKATANRTAYKGRLGLLLATALGSCVAIVSVGSARAETLAFKCEDETALSYTGDDNGTLSVRGAFGEMQVPATKVEREAVVDGESIKTVGIRAAGPATVLMPDKAKLEACLAGKGATRDDPDMLAYAVNLCRLEVPLGATPVEIDAEVTITLIDSPDAEVFISRTYRDESAVVAGRVKVDTFPILTCPAATSP